MRVSPAGLRLIQSFEGFSATPYRCPAGWLTIGYGHVLRAEEEGRLVAISHAKAEELLAADVALAEQAVTRLMTTALAQPQFDALVSFTYNLGSGALQRSRLRQVINRGALDAAPVEFQRWVWAGGRKLPGLVRRRAAEAGMFASGFLDINSDG